MTEDRSKNVVTCAEVREYLPAFLSDEISATDSRRIQEHLDGCASCRKFHGFEHAFDEMLDRCLTREQAPPELEDRVRRSLNEANVVRTERFTSWAGPGWRRWAIAAAILFVLVAPASVTYYDLLVNPAGVAIAGAEKNLTGTLVCSACERAGVETADQRGCRAHGHHVGFRCDQSGLWELVENDQTRSVINAANRIGDRVELQGVFLEDLRYVKVKSIRYVDRAGTGQSGL